MIVTHSNIVHEDSNGQAFNVLPDSCHVTFGARAEVHVDDLGPDALVLGLNVGGNILKLERSPAHLQIKSSQHVNTVGSQ